MRNYNSTPSPISWPRTQEKLREKYSEDELHQQAVDEVQQETYCEGCSEEMSRRASLPRKRPTTYPIVITIPVHLKRKGSTRRTGYARGYARGRRMGRICQNEVGHTQSSPLCISARIRRETTSDPRSLSSAYRSLLLSLSN